MSIESLQDAVTSLVDEYDGDLIMLDALCQWAMNPTSASAGYGIEQNYPYIYQNLKKRYPYASLEETMKKLRAKCTELSSKYDIYDCRKKIKEIIEKRNGEKLRSEVIERVNQLTLEEKKLCYICMMLKEQIRTPYFMSGYFLDPLISRFYAAGIVTTLQDAILIPLKTGLLNELLWISSGTSPPQSEYNIPKFIEPFLENIDKRIKEDISDLPNVKEYVKLLRDYEKFNQLRLLDELVNVGVSNDPSIGRIVVARSITGRYENYVATSPLIDEELKISLQEEKASLIQSFKTELEEILLKIRNKGFPEIELIKSPLDEITGWILEIEGTRPLHILLVPWILLRYMRLIKEDEKYVIITTNQSLPSISKIFDTFKGEGLVILCKFGNTLFFRAVGKRHKVLDEILEELHQNGYEIQESRASTTIEELEMAPERPFTNLTQVFELMQTLNGSILLLDKHFDEKGFKFLGRLDPRLVSNVKILMSRDHLSRDFKDIFKAFKDEMDNKGVKIELRILDNEDAEKIHDRYIISKNLSYNTPPWNIVHKRLGDILRIKNVESKRRYFNKYWSRAIDALKLAT